MFSLMPWRNVRKNVPTTQTSSPFELLERDFDEFFGNLFQRFPVAEEWKAPLWGLDVEELENETLVRAELPGFEVEDLNVQLVDDVLTIEAKHSEETQDGENGEKAEDAKPSRMQRRVHQLRRSIRLSKGHDVENIEANYRNGVLELRIPRLPDAQPRKIEIKG